MDADEAALFCRVLGDPNRMRIVTSLLGKELCACNLLEQFNIAQPTLSHHMQVLCDCGLVDARREGKWMHYSLNREKLSQLRQFIEELCSSNAEAEVDTSFAMC
ncbi:MAG: Transcriptional repressor SdpR [Spirochaetes bacterium ADurb.Bin110]|jgi:ArsR family transcriptional regulator|nr:MAG: Transcriptional repressor SdpR [Spirochaetes bacterium ADurb.Bin110]